MFLKMCEKDGATGTALLNAMGNVLVGFFMVTAFDSPADRMTELQKWSDELRRKVNEAHRLTNQ
jgi:hypothetical protein